MSTNPRADTSHQPARSEPLVGRAREREVLRDCLRAALAGQGRLVLVGGEAGIGKTTLVDWLVHEARLAGALAFQGHCYDLALTPPYGPWLGAFAASQPAGDRPIPAHPLQPGADLGAATSQALLFAQVRGYLATTAAAQPTVLVLEDLHWADPASLELLRFLAREASTLGLLLLATYRADELARQHPLSSMLPLLVREGRAERLDLQPLNDREVRELVAGRYPLVPGDEARLVAYLQSRAEGNPFYLGEVLRTLEGGRLLVSTGDGWRVGDLARAPVPPLVRQVIEGRLSRLDDDTQRLLGIAAMIGQDVPLDLWQRVGDADEARLLQAVERASDAALLRGSSGTASVSFAHSLVRDTCYLRLAPLDRRMLHRRVAEILADRPGAAPGIVASHFAQADDPRSISWLVHLGEWALALYAAEDAIAAITRAHELSARFAQDLPLAAYRTRAAAQAMAGAFDRARRDYELVLERGRASGDRRAEWQALVDLGMLWSERDYERTGDCCRAALDLARAIGDAPLIAHSLNRVANWHVNLDEPDVALPLHEEALALFEACGDREGIADTLGFLGMASYLHCDLPTSTRYHERAIAILRDLDDRQRLSTCLATLVLTGGGLDDLTAPIYREESFWIGSGEEALAIAREIGWAAGEAYALIALGMARGGRGDLGGALRDAEAARAVAARIDHHEWAIFARYLTGLVWIELLDLPRAEAILAQSLASARVSGSRFWTDIVSATLAMVHLDMGILDRAAATLDAAIQPDRVRPSMGQRECWFTQAGLVLARGEPGRALAICDQLDNLGPVPAIGSSLPRIAKLRGDAFAALGRMGEAEGEYTAARQGAALFGVRTLLWRIDAARGALYRAAGRVAEADAAIGDARATIAALAASIADDAISAQFESRALALLPSAPSDAPRPAGADLLSPRERDVLRLLVDGRSDREIAAALSISPRTVMRHVTGILNKFGVSSRTAAATFALRRNLL